MNFQAQRLRVTHSEDRRIITHGNENPISICDRRQGIGADRILGTPHDAILRSQHETAPPRDDEMTLGISCAFKPGGVPEVRAVQSTALDEARMVPVAPTARYCPAAYVTAESGRVVPEIRVVQLVALVDVIMLPFQPTAT